jgi:4-amino-4-deoxy-L-arabinose transferase-like glycosyltransferase
MTTRSTQHATRYASARNLLLLSTLLVLVLQTGWFVRSASTRGFATGDGGVKLWQVQGILHSGDLNAPLDYPGAIYDPDQQYAPFVEPWAMWYQGKPYTEYTSPFIWASVPLYALFGHAGLMLLPWLCGMLLILMTAWLAWRVRPDRSAALAPLVVGLGSPLLVYSLEFWEHTPGTALAVFALVDVVKALDSRRRAWWLIASGAAIGLSLTMRAELYVYPIAIVIGLLFIRSTLPLIRSSVWLAIGGLLTIGPWWMYQFVTWGSPFGPRLQQNVPVLGGTEMLTRLGDTTGRNWSMLFPAEGDGVTVLALLLAAMVVTAVLTGLLRRKIKWLADVGFWIGVVLSMLLAGLLVWQLAQGQRPDDLLTAFPIVLLLILPAPRGVPPTSNRQLPTANILRFLTVIPLAFVVLVILISPFHGGIQWGPRFLLPIIPPLTVVLIDRLAGQWVAINRSARVGLAAALIALLVAGSYSTWLGVKFMQDGQIASEFMSEVIRQSPERVVVADTWFLPQMAPYTFGEKIWLMAEDDQKMFQLLQRLRKQTDEPGILYTSALTWAHIDPQALMGPRMMPVEGSKKVYVNAPTQYVEISRYQLLK